MRFPLVIGNWKLHGNKKLIKDLIVKLCSNLTNFQGCKVIIAPPLIYLDYVKTLLNDSFIEIAAQNVDVNLSGAFTGDISANMIKDIGARYLIIGHSERRIHHKENDKLIAKKFLVLKSVGIIPVLCIGETKQEYENGSTEKVCMRQINAILNRSGIEGFKNTIVAYEPIWAIGTGQSAKPDHAQYVHKFIREYLANKNKEIADNLIIQYGGSVNSSNAAELFSQDDIDGALVGAASLNTVVFTEIINAAIKAKVSF
ncbi:MAG: triose-phosphate isomerase [Candidatus Dasytiphilus stammeri]